MSIVVQLVDTEYGDRLIAGSPIKSYAESTCKNLTLKVGDDIAIFAKSNLIGLTEQVLNQLVSHRQNAKAIVGIVCEEAAVMVTSEGSLKNIKVNSSIFQNLDNTTNYNLDTYNLKLINSTSDLIDFEQDIQKTLRYKAIEKGVFMQDPNTTFLSYDTEFASGVRIEPNVCFGPKVKLGDDVHIKAFSYLEDVTIENEVTIGPYARIRGTSKIGNKAKIGNFVEVKNSEIGEGVKAGHLSYIGDSTIGSEVTIGAGTVTCNYDGKAKHRTNIGKNSFIGSNISLIAPINIGENCFVGAGSIIYKDVQDRMFAINRGKQETKPNKREL